MKNSLSSLEIITEWIWYGWTDKSNIHLAACSESMMITMQLMLANWVAWLMPHLIAKSLASVDVILTAWWRVLITGLLWT